MEEKYYLFIFDDDSFYEMTCGISPKDALWEMAKYRGEGSDMLLKCLRGYEEDDIKGMVELYNTLSNYDVIKEIKCADKIEVLYKKK